MVQLWQGVEKLLCSLWRALNVASECSFIAVKPVCRPGRIFGQICHSTVSPITFFNSLPG